MPSEHAKESDSPEQTNQADKQHSRSKRIRQGHQLSIVYYYLSTLFFADIIITQSEKDKFFNQYLVYPILAMTLSSGFVATGTAVGTIYFTGSKEDIQKIKTKVMELDQVIKRMVRIRCYSFHA